MVWEKPMVAALFMTLSACLGLGMGLLFIAEAIWPEALEVDTDTLYLSFICSPMFIIAGLMSLMGTLACLKGKGWNMAMLGAVASLISGLLVLGFLSIIFVYNAKPEFLK